MLRAPELLTLSPTVAVEAQLAMLAAFAPLRSASLWTLDDAEQVSCVRHVGEGGPSRGAKELARRLLAGESTEPGARRLLLGLPVGRWQQPLAALVGSAKPGMRESCHSFLAEAVPMLGAVLERDALLAGNAASERALVESSERKLTRLGFDLHDGPIQDVAVLAEDLRLFRDQLEIVLGTPPSASSCAGRLDDLDAQLVALDVELRRISNEVHAASVLLNRPFTRALRDVAQAFAARTNIEPRLTLEGEMRLLSASQQIALLNIIHEALTNIREHSDATEVEIAVSVNAEGVEAQVVDNGRGFDLEPTLIRAARRGPPRPGRDARAGAPAGRAVPDRQPAGRADGHLRRARALGAARPRERASSGEPPLGLASAPGAAPIGLRGRPDEGGGWSEVVLEGVTDRGAAVGDAQLAIDVRQMELDRVLAQPQVLADRLRRQAARRRPSGSSSRAASARVRWESPARRCAGKGPDGTW